MTCMYCLVNIINIIIVNNVIIKIYCIQKFNIFTIVKLWVFLFLFFSSIYFALFIIPSLYQIVLEFDGKMYQFSSRSSRVCVGICNYFSNKNCFRGSNFSIRINRVNKILFSRGTCYTWGIWYILLIFNCRIILSRFNISRG